MYRYWVYTCLKLQVSRIENKSKPEKSQKTQLKKQETTKNKKQIEGKKDNLI